MGSPRRPLIRKSGHRRQRTDRDYQTGALATHIGSMRSYFAQGAVISRCGEGSPSGERQRC